MYDIKRPALANDDPRLFKIKTGAVKAIKEVGSDGKERCFLEGIASSTVVDRHGDTITEQAQAQMVQAARDLVMWLNHSYNVPEDILGVCRESTLQAAVDESGNCLDLIIRLEVYPDNPRAMKSWNAVQWGTRLGFSIGGQITDFAFADEDDWWSSLIINGIDLYEISLVGIPANPRAYTKFVEDIAGKMRSAAVDKAQEIVGKAASKDAAQLLLKKSLIGDAMIEKTADVQADVTEPVVEPVSEPDVQADVAADVQPDVAADAQPDVAVEPDATESDVSPPDVQASIVTKAFPDEDVCANIVRSLQLMKASITHGMCSESIKDVASAHALMKSMLPADYPYEDDPADLTDAAAIDTVKIAELTDALTAKTAELDTLSSTVAQRAAEVSEAQTRIDTLKAEEITLQQKIDALKATPTGRQTAQAGGSHSGAAYTIRASTADQARKNLGARLAGVALQDDPARRPA